MPRVSSGAAASSAIALATCDGRPTAGDGDMATLPDGSAGDIEVDELERSCGLDDELSIALVHHAAALESGVGVAAVP